MAEYTIELRTIVESGINIFDFPYEFYDNNKKEKFERDFIRHFYFREIGVETIDKFIFYLNDKMQTVFPYYNKLMQASEVEYDLLDHYRLTETLERQIDNQTHKTGVTSSVGRFEGEQNGETQTDETGENTSNLVNDGFDKETLSSSKTGEGSKNIKSERDIETDKTHDSERNILIEKSVDSETTSTSSETSKTESSGSETSTSKNINQFLDTPQGKINLDDPKYLTELRQDDNTSSKTTESETSSESETEGSQTTGTTEEDKQKDEYSETAKETTNDDVQTDETENTSEDFESLGTKETTTTQDLTDKSSIHNTTTTINTDTQKIANDVNDRQNESGTQKEVYTMKREGNIGVQTDAEGIEKHVLLRKTLDNLKRMFFDECEDLFMMIY